MKNSFVLAAIATLALSGCNSIQDYAKDLTKELGITVELKTDDNDTCAKSQLERLSQAYGHLDKAKQEDFKKALSKYKKLIIEPTEIVSTVTGDVVSLGYGTWESVCDYVGNHARCWNVFRIKSSRVIEDRREGVMQAEVQLKKDENIDLQMQSIVDSSLRVVYGTDSATIYDLVDSRDSDVFKRAVDRKEIWIHSSEEQSETVCGKAAALADLI